MTSNNFNDDDKLKDMFEAASADSDTLADKEPPKDDSKKKAILTAVGVMVGFGVLLGAGALMLRPQEFEDKTEAPTWVDTQVEKVEKSEEYNMWDFEYPVEVPEWTKEPYRYNNFADNEEELAKLTEYAESYNSLFAGLAWLPSGIQGDWEGAGEPYTSNIEEEYINDDIPNPQFSYALREDYIFAYTTYIQRLINPVFGDWAFSQESYSAKDAKSDTQFEVLNDMFSTEWWETNIANAPDYSNLPIVADWAGDSFGGMALLDDKEGRIGEIFGVINETEDNYISVDVLGQDERGSDILKIDTPIKYVGVDKDKNTLEKNGTLSITIASNENYISENRVVIINTSLTIK